MVYYPMDKRYPYPVAMQVVYSQCTVKLELYVADGIASCYLPSNIS